MDRPQGFFLLKNDIQPGLKGERSKVAITWEEDVRADGQFQLNSIAQLKIQSQSEFSDGVSFGQVNGIVKVPKKIRITIRGIVRKKRKASTDHHEKPDGPIRPIR